MTNLINQSHEIYNRVNFELCSMIKKIITTNSWSSTAKALDIVEVSKIHSGATLNSQGIYLKVFTQEITIKKKKHKMPNPGCKALYTFIYKDVCV